MGPEYKLTYWDVHKSLLQTPLSQPVSTPLFLQGFTPTCSGPNVLCSRFRRAYATKDANMSSRKPGVTWDPKTWASVSLVQQNKGS